MGIIYINEDLFVFNSDIMSALIGAGDGKLAER